MTRPLSRDSGQSDALRRECATLEPGRRKSMLVAVRLAWVALIALGVGVGCADPSRLPSGGGIDGGGRADGGARVDGGSSGGADGGLDGGAVGGDDGGAAGGV